MPPRTKGPARNPGIARPAVQKISWSSTPLAPANYAGRVWVRPTGYVPTGAPALPLILRNPQNDNTKYDYLKDGPSCVVKVGPSDYRMLFEMLTDTRGANTNFMGYATSTNGVDYVKYAGNPILSPSSVWQNGEICPCAVLYDPATSRYLLYYHGGGNAGPRQMGVMWSPNMLPDTWTDLGIVLANGGSGAWDEKGVADGKVFRLGPNDWRMIYKGFRVSDGKSQLGLATAPDPLGPWTKSPSNPILPFGANLDVFSLNGGAADIDASGRVHLWYPGVSSDGVTQTILYATSDDPNWLTWTRDTNTGAAFVNGSASAPDGGSIGDVVTLVNDDGLLFFQMMNFNFSSYTGDGLGRLEGRGQYWLPRRVVGTALRPGRANIITTDSTRQYVALPNTAKLLDQTVFSIYTEFRAPPGNSTRMFYLEGNTFNVLLSLGLQTDGTFSNATGRTATWYRATGSTMQFTVAGSPAVATRYDDNKLHWVLLRRIATGSWELIVDGTVIATSAVDPGTSALTPAISAMNPDGSDTTTYPYSGIGGGALGWGGFVQRRLVTIAGYAMTAAEGAALFNNSAGGGRVPTSGTLKVDMLLGNGGTAGPDIDASANRYSGTVVGPVFVDTAPTDLGLIVATATGAIPLAGTVDGTVASASATGTASGPIPVAGTATAAALVQAAATSVIPIAGTVAATGTVQGAAAGAIPLGGSASGAVSVQAASTAAIPIAGSVTGAGAIAAASTRAIPVGGTVASTGAVQGASTAAIPIGGTVAGSGTIQGASTSPVPVAGTVAATSAIAGASTLPIPIAGTVAASGGGATGTVSGAIPIGGTVAATSPIAAASTRAIAIGGAVAGSATMQGASTSAIPVGGTVAGSVAGVATVSGPIPIGGQVQASGGGISCAVSGPIPVGGSVAANSTLTASSTTAVPIGGTVAVAVLAQAAAASPVPIAGSAAATALVQGASTRAVPVAGTVAATSTIAGASTQPLPIGGAVAAVAPEQAASTQPIPIGGQVQASGGGISAAVAAAIPIGGGVTATSTITGASARVIPIAGTVAASLVGNGAVVGQIPIAGTVTALGGLTATAIGGVAIGGTVAGTLAASAASTAPIPITGTVAASGGGASGSVVGPIPIAGAATGVNGNNIIASGRIPVAGLAAGVVLVVASAASPIPIGGTVDGTAPLPGRNAVSVFALAFGGSAAGSLVVAASSARPIPIGGTTSSLATARAASTRRIPIAGVALVSTGPYAPVLAGTVHTGPALRGRVHTGAWLSGTPTAS